MKPWFLLGIGLGTYALGLVSMAPASLLDAALREWTGSRIRLVEAHGTLWHGTGQIELLDKQFSRAIVKPIAWSLLPEYLLRGRLHYELEVNQSGRRVEVLLSPTQAEVNNLDIELPASAIGMVLANIAPLELTGNLSMHLEHFVFGRDEMRGNATVKLLAAGSLHAALASLGDYELFVEGSGATARAVLRTLQGPLQIDGNGTWAVHGNSAFVGTARIAPQNRQQLSPLLRMFAVERAEGLFDLVLNF